MNRSQVCYECDAADTLEGRLACDYIGEQREGRIILSCCALQRLWADPDATCPHPDGNQWDGAAIVPLPVIQSSGHVASRAAVCQKCPHFKFASAKRWTCARRAGEPVNALLADPAAACPDDPPRWEAVQSPAGDVGMQT